MSTLVASFTRTHSLIILCWDDGIIIPSQWCVKNGSTERLKDWPGHCLSKRLSMIKRSFTLRCMVLPFSNCEILDLCSFIVWGCSYLLVLYNGSTTTLEVNVQNPCKTSHTSGFDKDNPIMKCVFWKANTVHFEPVAEVTMWNKASYFPDSMRN